jgi:hypothetical protein
VFVFGVVPEETSSRSWTGLIIASVVVLAVLVAGVALLRRYRPDVLRRFRRSTPDDVPASDPPPSSGRRRRSKEEAGSGGVFISYRRADSADITGRLYDRLAAHFARERLFKDVDSIPLGLDFRDDINRAIAQSSVLLAVIGPRWLEDADGRGARVHDPTDHLRLEIEAALARGIPVIPVLVNGARMPAASDLPESLLPLVYRNAIEVRADPDFHHDTDRLIRGITAHIAGS